MGSIQEYKEGCGRVDFHLHTINSDGENTPDEVIRLAAQEGLSVIALTDHNKFSLVKPVTVDVPRRGDFEHWNLTVLPGCEFSVSYPIPARNGENTEIHIVGVFPDGVNPDEFVDIFANGNVNIKMLKKWKIKMYIFQELFLSLRFHKGSFLFQTV